MSELTKELAKLLEGEDKNYDPRMEELMRSDRLIDPSYENLSVLEDPEIFHVAKIRGAQQAFNIPVWRIKRAYETPDMLDYHTPWMDYIRSLNPAVESDKKVLDSFVGDFNILNEMVNQLIKLRPALEGKRANLYAESIKPQVGINPAYMPQPEPQESIFSKIGNFFFGKKDDDNRGYSKGKYR